MPWIIQTIVTMGSRYHTFLLTVLLVGVIFDFASNADDEKHEIIPGSTFQHPIYLTAQEGQKAEMIRGIGDSAKLPAIMYIVRLEPGQEVTVELTSTFDKDRGQQPFLLYLFDAKTTSLVGSGTNWIVQERGSPMPTKVPNLFRASFRFASPFASPVANDYYIVPVFESAGIVFTLKVEVTRVLAVPLHVSCVTGPLSEPIYVSPGDPDSLISDITIGDQTKAKKPDERNRRFCVAQACTISPPTSLFLTNSLRDAIGGKKKVKACWDSSNTISEISVP